MHFLQKNGAKITIAILSIILLILIVVMSVLIPQGSNFKGITENLHQSAFYDLKTSVSNMENTLYKFDVNVCDSYCQSLLLNVVVNSEVATTSLQTLVGNYDTTQLTRFTNIVGDYCKSLMHRLSYQEKLEDSDKTNLADMAVSCKEIGENLLQIQALLEEDKSYILKNVEVLEKTFTNYNSKLQELSATVPTLIYDGPFSDALQQKTPKALENLQDVDKTQAENILKQSKDITSIEYLGENESYIKQHRYKISAKNGEATACISVKGGKLVSFNFYREITNPQLTEEQAIKKAEDFCVKIGLKNMKAVWCSNSSSSAYINLVPNVNNILFYPDMVKVKVAMDTGDIISYEASAYLYNHTKRTISQPQLSLEEAMAKFSKQNIEKSTLTLVPQNNNKEILCYEFFITTKEQSFFVYINATTGKTENILHIVKSDRGNLLI
ncbi:MAG: germination protein YpeB [Clostridia bacterium]